MKNEGQGRKVVAISMPQATYDDMVGRLREMRYSSVSEYIRDLIRKDEWARFMVEYKGDPNERRRIEDKPVSEFTYRTGPDSAGVRVWYGKD